MDPALLNLGPKQYSGGSILLETLTYRHEVSFTVTLSAYFLRKLVDETRIHEEDKDHHRIDDLNQKFYTHCIYSAYTNIIL